MIETFGWVGLIFSLTGLIVSSHTVAYYFGHRRGLGQFQFVNPFGPKPIKSRPDQQYVDDYKMARASYDSMKQSYIALDIEYKRLRGAYEVLEEKSSASVKRAARRAMERDLLLEELTLRG